MVTHLLRWSLAATLLAGLAGTATAQAAAPGGAIPSQDDAPIALLLDMTSGQTLFARNVNRRFAPASITKVMTTYVAFENLKAGKLKLDRVIQIRPDTFREWSGVGSTMYLPNDARLTVDQLLHGITTVSGNDASVVLAEGTAGSVGQWLDMMNRTARSIGMRDSHFGTPNGWPDEGQTYTTASDLALLAEALITGHPAWYEHFFGNQSFSYNGITQYNHDPISGKVPGADGLKTGFTNQAGYGFLGSAKRGNRRLIMVVATSDTARQRNRAAIDLLEWGFANFRGRRLFAANEPVAFADLQNGSSRTVALVSRQPIAVTSRTGTQPAITLSIRYDGPLRAPVQAGERIAWLDIRMDGSASHSVPLVAAAAVDRAGPLERIANGIIGWFS